MNTGVPIHKNKKKLRYYLLIDHNKCFTSTVKSYCP